MAVREESAVEAGRPSSKPDCPLVRCEPLLGQQCECAKSSSATLPTEQRHTRSYPPAWALPTIPVVPPEATIDPTGTK